MIAQHETVVLPIGDIREAAWNANKAGKRTMAKIRQSVRLFGVVENNVVRPSWCIGVRTTDELVERKAAAAFDCDEWYETLSGNHRLRIYNEEKLAEVLCVVVELPDSRAKMLAQALNRLGGTDDPELLKALLKDVMQDETPADVATLLPHSERDLMKLLDGSEDEQAPEIPTGPPDSQPGVIYQLGPHRLLCGDSTNADAVAELLQGEEPRLLATDPPYGVELQQGWRDDVALSEPWMGGQGAQVGRWQSGQNDAIEGDDGFDWTIALNHAPCIVAYVWHASGYDEVKAALVAHGFTPRQQLIWKKERAVLSRSDYHWQHECCWYAVKAGKTAGWNGGRAQTTVWEAASPKQIFGTRAEGDEAKEDHPTQKPLLLFETPIMNHLKVGESVYDPFVGSGTALIAAARTGRVCYGVDISPKYVDLCRRRYTRWAMANGQEAGPGAL